MTKLREASYVVLNTLIAVFATAAIQTRIPHPVPHSGADVIWREWITSTFVAALLGVLAGRYRTAKTAGWAWLIPAAVFALRALRHLFGSNSRFWSHFSGYDCAVGLVEADCHDFLSITVPLIRGLSYSAAARLALRVSVWLKVAKGQTA
jgi:hypothetical protein